MNFPGSEAFSHQLDETIKDTGIKFQFKKLRTFSQQIVVFILFLRRRKEIATHEKLFHVRNLAEQIKRKMNESYEHVISFTEIFGCVWQYFLICHVFQSDDEENFNFWKSRSNLGAIVVGSFHRERLDSCLFLNQH